MARAVALKVYVTPAGFYDAVVAAPNQKAALTAWGARSDLFGEKLAALETDDEWREKALASPGEVIRKPRGDAEPLLAAPTPKRSADPSAKPAPGPRQAQVKPPPKPKPPPDRRRLEAAEQQMAAAQVAVEVIRSDFERRRRELEEDERREVAAAQSTAAKAQAQHERARVAYDKQLKSG